MAFGVKKLIALPAALELHPEERGGLVMLMLLKVTALAIPAKDKTAESARER
jgi:hypothetical protein